MNHPPDGSLYHQTSDYIILYQIISFYILQTIGEDGTVKIADSTGTFGADAFTYTEVDDDTVRLKVDTDNALVGMFSVDMDYECDGELLC